MIKTPASEPGRKRFCRPEVCRKFAKNRQRPLALELLQDRLTPSTFAFNSAFYSASESSESVQITVVREGTASGVEVVHFATKDRSAAAGTRYVQTSGDLTFQPTDTSKSFSIPIINDNILNHLQSLEVELSAPSEGATLGAQALAIVTIADDETPVSLSQLQVSRFANFPAEGRNNLQYLPDGSLAQLLWLGTLETGFDLTYLQRNAFGEWTSEVVFTHDTGFAPVDLHFDNSQAQLVIDSTGVPHVLVQDYGFDNNQTVRSVLHYRRQADGWHEVEEVLLPLLASHGFYTSLAATLGVNNSLHLAVVAPSLDKQVNLLVYATNKSGVWQSEGVTTLGEQEPLVPYDSRIHPLSIAIDSQNAAHIAYTPAFLDNAPPGSVFGRPFSQLAYAGNRAGAWTTQIVWQPPDDSGDAGYGSSIAVGPGNQVGIASFFVDRVATGSPAFSQLLYHALQPNGAFATAIVAAASDNYAAADGPQFTGFAPQLLFDPQGRPTIAFSDYASQHFPSFGAIELAGQLRQATLVGGQWQIQNIMRQANPLDDGLAYPTMAIGPAGVAYSALLISASGGNADDPGTIQAVTYTIVTTDGGGLGSKLAAIASIFTHSAENYGNIIEAAYDRYLKRSPDSGGIAYWIGQMQAGLTDEQLESSFLGSTEYIVGHGGLNSNGVPLPAWVQGMYRDLLGREADPDGLSYWSGVLAAGVPAFSIALGFAASAERETARIGANYTSYLDRYADPGGISYWLGQFLQGKTNEDLAAGFIGSAEYYFNHGKGTPTTWLNALYQEILHRAPASHEIDYWLGVLGVK
jgi:hypothetical protein